LITFRIL